jgi:branched-chain amino acid transport system substrate-binding protein
MHRAGRVECECPRARRASSDATKCAAPKIVAKDDAAPGARLHHGLLPTAHMTGDKTMDWQPGRIARTVAALAAGALVAMAAHAQQTLKIGVVLSTSGPAAVFGIPERDAINVAANYINAHGGVNGRKIELFHYDDKTNPTEAARAVTQLVSTHNVVAIIGPGTGGGALAAGPVAEKARVPLLVPAGTIAITDRKNSFFPWVFRVGVNDLITVKGILADIVKNGGRRVGVFYQEDAYGKAGADYAASLAKDLGFEFVESVSAPYNATDVSAQVTRLRNAKVDAVFTQVAISSLGAAYVKAADQVGLKVPTYGGSGLVQKTFLDAVGKAGDGMRVTSIGNLAHDPSPSEAKFGAILKSAGKTPSGWMELIGSNGLMTAVAAAKKVNGEPTGAAMRDAIETLCDFEIHTRGRACFSKDNHDGFGESSLVITEIRDGAFRSRK